MDHKEKTIVIVGYAHSGTTMLAGVLEILGVPMVGEDYKDSKWEDNEINKSLELGNFERFKNLVAKRNKQGTWGFKFPGAWMFAEQLTILRNPVYIAMFKDPVSVTNRRFGKVNLSCLKNTLDRMAESAGGMKILNNVHLFSYQKFTQDPKKYVARLAKLAGKDLKKDDIKRCMDYIQPNETNRLIAYPSIKKHLK